MKCLLNIRYTGLPTKDETVKIIWNLINMIISRFNLLINGLFLSEELTQFTVDENHEYMKNRPFTFRTVASEVSSFESNPVSYKY